MYSTIMSGGIFGMQAYLVCVEVDIAPGLPGFSMVGSLGSQVKESRERVMVALKNAGLRLPPNHVTINLSPADRRKEGTAYDLPIAVGMLASLGYFPKEAAENTLFVGELGLNGEIKRVRGILPIVREAARCGIRQCIVPGDNAAEGAVVPNVTVRGVHSVEQLLAFLKAASHGDPKLRESLQEKALPAVRVDAMALFEHKEAYLDDFSEVRGQETAKRAAEIAAAGFHNLLLTGPPGAGKSMIAGRIPGILPPLTPEESLEVTGVASVAGVLEAGSSLVTKRPFIRPHHTTSVTALIGGSASPRPGMISLAHRGVLFLDELPEFQRQTLDSLRQPLEERSVHISRIWGNVTFPSDFMLVCAMNPCPCGYYPDKNKCRCSKRDVQRYLSRVSGPILDRFDLCAGLQTVELVGLQGQKKGESSEEMGRRVQEARNRQKERFAGSGYRFNADIRASDMEKYCKLGRKEEKLMEELYHSMQMTARAYHRILRVARTIADLEGAAEIGEPHLLEASFFRPDLEYWKGEGAVSEKGIL